MSTQNINKGDAVYLKLDFTVKTDAQTTMSLYEFVQTYGVDEIELTLGEARYLLSASEIEYDAEDGAYYIALTQEVSFAANRYTNYQLRLKRNGFLVCSSQIYTEQFGGVLSKEVI